MNVYNIISSDNNPSSQPIKVMNLKNEELTNLSIEELEVLADISLVPKTQIELNELLNKNADNQISDEERIILDNLLSQIDNLNILKTRAKYTLKG